MYQAEGRIILKAQNLEILKTHGFPVPKFITVKSVEELTPTQMFLLKDDLTYAVRSSFGAEDSINSSFAGQFDTLLNVKKEDLKKAVETVLNSVKNKNVSTYSELKNISVGDSGCVIVQEMIDADLSGVIFTANPMGVLNETVVVVGKGLGCNVVEDKIDTTTYYYNQDDDLYYSEKHGNSPEIKEHLLVQLIEMAKKIKCTLGYEVDIEYALKDEKVYILQARPITTLDFSCPIILDNSNIVESYPGVSLPLTQDFVKSIYHDIFYNCVLRITEDKELVDGMDVYLQDMVDIANWRIYYRISNWYAVLKLLPMSSKIIPMWQKMLGVSNTSVSAPDVKVNAKTKRKIIRSFINYLRKTPELMSDLNERFANRLPEYRKTILESNTREELLNVYETIKKEILSDWDITLINDMYTFIYTALAGNKNKAVLANIKNLESMKPVYGINELVKIAQSEGLSSESYVNSAVEYIKTYGDRCLNELKLETHTYRTHPELLHECVKSKMDSDVVKLQRGPEITNKNPFVKRAKQGIMNREVSRMSRSRIFGLSREIFSKIGQDLFDARQIESKEDVFYLHIDELLDRETNFRKLVKKRKCQEQMYQNTPAYSRLVFTERIIDKHIRSARNGILHQSDEFFGIATSTGKVTGEVLVIDIPNDTIDTTGKILVTKSTDPGWVFLIQNAIGIIAEKGSLLSHTAIISRELHKPAVVNVKDCTKLLKTGDVIELDAYTGVIKKI